mgnify:CR=1 FL=1
MVEENTEQKKINPGIGFRARLFLVVVTLAGAAFLPVTVVFIVGMLPTVAALLVDTSRDKTRPLTIGLMNFVGCFPFLMDVAFQPQTLQSSYQVLSEPINIILMYAGAVAGYCLDWTMAGMSNVIMTARAKQRLEAIDRRQAELKRRWGEEVTGDIPLDGNGFPLIQIEE